MATVNSALNGNLGATFAVIHSQPNLPDGASLPVTFVGYGGAVSHTSYKGAIEAAGGQFSGAFANPGDIVSELISLNRGNLVPPGTDNPSSSQSKSLNIFQGIGAASGSLWDGSMGGGAHSYTCQVNCGNQPSQGTSAQPVSSGQQNNNKAPIVAQGENDEDA